VCKNIVSCSLVARWCVKMSLVGRWLLIGCSVVCKNVVKLLGGCSVVCKNVVGCSLVGRWCVKLSLVSRWLLYGV
jgi:hypothetical protein